LEIRRPDCLRIAVFQYTIIYNDKNRKSKIWKTLNTLHSVSYLSGWCSIESKRKSTYFNIQLYITIRIENLKFEKHIWYLIVYNYCIYICTVLYDLIKLSQFGHIVGGIWQDEDGTRRSPHFTWAHILKIHCLEIKQY
jgi:hypothetical protein